MLAAPMAYAHHSMAMFDGAKTVTLVGTVKSFRWSSPHAFIEITVPYKSGPIDWNIEMGGGGVSSLLRAGWTPETIKFGDKVKIVGHDVGVIENGDRVGVTIEYEHGDYWSKRKRVWLDELRADGGLNELFKAVKAVVGDRRQRPQEGT